MVARTWILVAHEAGARVFENLAASKEAELIEHLGDVIAV